jgi:hypothetical protein
MHWVQVAVVILALGGVARERQQPGVGLLAYQGASGLFNLIKGVVWLLHAEAESLVCHTGYRQQW